MWFFTRLFRRPSVGGRRFCGRQKNNHAGGKTWNAIHMWHNTDNMPHLKAKCFALYCSYVALSLHSITINNALRVSVDYCVHYFLVFHCASLFMWNIMHKLYCFPLVIYRKHSMLKSKSFLVLCVSLMKHNELNTDFGLNPCCIAFHFHHCAEVVPHWKAITELAICLVKDFSPFYLFFHFYSHS